MATPRKKTTAAPPAPEPRVWNLRLHKPPFSAETIAAIAFLIVVVFSQTGLFTIPLKIHGTVNVDQTAGPGPYVPPGPNPGPGPGPGPVDPRFEALATDAARWASEVRTSDRAAEASAIADAFDSVAARAAAGTLSLADIFGSKGRPGVLAQEVARALGRQNDNWKSWGDQLSRGLGHLYGQKTLQTSADAAAALRAVAVQLRRVT